MHQTAIQLGQTDNLAAILLDWTTTGGRRLGAAARETLAYLVDEAGYRRTWFQLANNPFKVDPRTMLERLRRLEADGTVRIYRTLRGRGGGVELRVRDLHQIAAYRRDELDRSKWRLAAIALDDPPPATLAMNPARLSSPKSERDEIKAGVSAPKPPLLFPEPTDDPPVDPIKAGVSAQKPPLFRAPIEWPEPTIAAFGADRFASLLANCALGADARTCYLTAPNDFTRDYLRRNHLAELRAALAAAGLPVDLVFEVDPTPPPSRAEPKAGVSAPKPPLLRAQEGRKILLQRIRLSSLPLNKQTNKQEAILQIRKTAADVFDALRDQTLFPWVALVAALEIAAGTLAGDRLADLLEERRGDFAAALKAELGPRWPNVGRVKSKLYALGIDWRRAWCDPVTKTRQTPNFDA